MKKLYDHAICRQVKCSKSYSKGNDSGIYLVQEQLTRELAKDVQNQHYSL